MNKTAVALNDAINVLKDATAGHEEGVLVQVQRSRLATNEGFAQREEKAAQLARVSELGDRVTTKGDALLPQRLLSGDVPQPEETQSEGNLQDGLQGSFIQDAG